MAEAGYLDVDSSHQLEKHKLAASISRRQHITSTGHLRLLDILVPAVGI